jgi:hypothetical protein
MPLESMQLDLEHVFGPYMSCQRGAVTINVGDTRAYFRGWEDNPLRACYESLVVTLERS